jgi:hypothetical protein
VGNGGRNNRLLLNNVEKCERKKNRPLSSVFLKAALVVISVDSACVVDQNTLFYSYKKRMKGCQWLPYSILKTAGFRKEIQANADIFASYART